MGDGLFSPWHIIIVLALAAILFYRGDKLPDVARSIGRSLNVFKKEIKGLTEDDDSARTAEGESTSTGPVDVHKAIEAPAAERAPRVVATPSEPIPVRAEVVRAANPAQQGQDSRPRPRPAGSAARQ